MKTPPPPPPRGTETSSLLILPDGRILARNVTPAVAALLLVMQPKNEELATRARPSTPPLIP